MYPQAYPIIPEIAYPQKQDDRQWVRERTRYRPSSRRAMKQETKDRMLMYYGCGARCKGVGN